MLPRSTRHASTNSDVRILQYAVAQCGQVGVAPGKQVLDPWRRHAAGSRRRRRVPPCRSLVACTSFHAAVAEAVPGAVRGLRRRSKFILRSAGPGERWHARAPTATAAAGIRARTGTKIGELPCQDACLSSRFFVSSVLLLEELCTGLSPQSVGTVLWSTNTCQSMEARCWSRQLNSIGACSHARLVALPSGVRSYDGDARQRLSRNKTASASIRQPADVPGQKTAFFDAAYHCRSSLPAAAAHLRQQILMPAPAVVTIACFIAFGHTCVAQQPDGIPHRQRTAIVQFIMRLIRPKARRRPRIRHEERVRRHEARLQMGRSASACSSLFLTFSRITI